MEATGISRSRLYTREEICARFGYDQTDTESRRNLNRFFKTNFLDRGLKAVQIGKTYEVAGELYYAWTLANSRQIEPNEVQTGQT